MARSEARKAADRRYQAKLRSTPEGLEFHRTYMREWNRKNPEKAKLHRRKKALKSYGLDPSDPIAHWETEWVSQGRRCKICRAAEPGTKGGWHTDHDHATGKFRGILCHKCNLTLGSAGDDLDRLRRCVEYLEEGGRIPCHSHSN